MMKAHEARDASAAGRIRTQEEARAKRRAEEEARQREEEEQAAQLWPAIRDGVETCIDEATHEGLRAASYRVPCMALVRRIDKWLTDLGYHVQYNKYHEEHDYGDSAAPCRVTETGYQISISW